MTPRTRKEKFLYRGSVERVLHCGSMDDYADLLFGIEHHNRLLEQERRSSNTLEVWKWSYAVEVQKGSYNVEAWTIVPIRC